MSKFLLTVPLAVFCAYSFSGSQAFFTENMGQWPDDILFMSSTAGSDVLVRSGGVTVHHENGDVVEYAVAGGQAVPLGEAPHLTNYFYGNDPDNWVVGVPSWTAVRFDGAGGSAEFILAEDGLAVIGDAEVRCSCNGEEQENALVRMPVLLPSAGTVEAYFCTYLGASAEDRSYSIAFGADEKVYITGRTSSPDFPVQNPYQGSYGGGDWDIFVTCMSADGSQLFYSTYIGGSGAENGYGIMVDDEGAAYVTGPTESSNFPVQNPFQSTLGGTKDAFILKLSAAGNSLAYSTYLGGSGSDFGRDLVIDGNGSAYITGTASSSDFPVQDPWQAASGGGNDAFLTRISQSGTSLVCSTYLGGSSDEAGEGISIDPNGNVLLTGTTSSSNFPTASPVQGTYGGNADGYVTSMDASGSTVLFSTYLGGSGAESAENVSANQDGIAVTGRTESTDFPLVNPLQGSLPGASSAFVTRYGSTGTVQTFSTYMGGSQEDYGRDLAVADDGSVFVTGYTSSTDFPLVNPWQGSYGGGANDCFMVKISSDDSLEYSTFLGGSDNDSSRALALLSGGGAVAVTGGMFSQDFPMLNPYQGSHGGGVTDCFVAVFTYDPQSIEEGELPPGNAIGLGVSANPVPGQISISITVPDQAVVDLGLYDMSGRLLETIAPSVPLEAGSHSTRWNRGNLPAGTYVIRASAPGLGSAASVIAVI